MATTGGSPMTMLAAIPAMPVLDIAEGIEFYTSRLGLQVLHQEGGFAVLGRDRIEIHLWEASDDSWKSRTTDRPIVSGAESFIAGTNSCRIEVADIDALYTSMEPGDIQHPNAQLEDKPWNMREFGILDPYGNLITFFERLVVPQTI